MKIIIQPQLKFLNRRYYLIITNLYKKMISIILPIRSEVQGIEKTIQSIISQTLDKDYEIIITDGMNRRGTSLSA